MNLIYSPSHAEQASEIGVLQHRHEEVEAPAAEHNGMRAVPLHNRTGRGYSEDNYIRYTDVRQIK